ncbi:MAG: insulinase family protein, partial [Bacteroidetes bacterium]|nr:insulinase family protein [Bacteroidota bacterium]
GRCRPTDMEQLFQLLNLYFTQPRFDPQSFDAYVKRQRSFYDNMGSNPASYFSVKWSKFVNMNHARSFDIPTESDWNSTDLAAIEKVYRDRFANPADFNFCFVGNIDEASLKNYCATYLGGLKTSDKREKAKDINIPYRSGTERLTVKKGADPKSQVRIAFHKDIAYDPILDLKLDMAAEVLTIKMIEVLREDMSGVYGTSARNYFSRSPKPGFSFYISFPCGPENVDTLIGAALHQLKLLAKDGPTQKDLDKVKQTMIKEVTTDVQSNSFWLNSVTNSLLYGDPIPTESDVKKRIEQITREDVKAAVATYLQGDYLTGVLLPEND